MECLGLRPKAQPLGTTPDEVCTERETACYGKFVSDGMRERGAGGLSLQTALFKKHKLVLRYQGLSNVLVSADVTCLLNSGVVHMTCTGFQKEVIFFTVKR